MKYYYLMVCCVAFKEDFELQGHNLADRHRGRSDLMMGKLRLRSKKIPRQTVIFNCVINPDTIVIDRLLWNHVVQ
jgi:hypothetical protein